MTLTALPPAAHPEHAVLTALLAELEARDADPAYAHAPVLDVYGRISKDPLTGETEAVDRQITDCLRDLSRRRARLGKVLRDDGISAWKLTSDRKGWKELVHRLEDGLSSGVIAWHTDRLMRQPRDLERLIDLGNRGVLVASCHGDYDLARADDRFTLRILTAAAAKDSDNTSRRQLRKAQAMRDSGRRSGGRRAFGEPGNLQPGVPAGEQQVTQERQAVASAVRDHLNGVSLRAITRQWNDAGLRTTFGNEWDPASVAALLRAPRLAGLLEHQGVIVGRLEGVEPIISVEDHEAALALFASRRRGRPISEAYLLSGSYLFCEHCQHALTGKPKTGKNLPKDGTGRRMYLCRARGGGCGRMSIEMTRCDDAVRDIVIERLSDPKHAKQVARQSAALAEVQAKLDREQATAMELSRRLGEGLMPFERYDVAIAPVEVRIARFRQEVDALRGTGAGRQAQAVSADDLALDWQEATVDERRGLVRAAAPYGFQVLAAQPRHHGTAGVRDRLDILKAPLRP